MYLFRLLIKRQRAFVLINLIILAANCCKLAWGQESQFFESLRLEALRANVSDDPLLATASERTANNNLQEPPQTNKPPTPQSKASESESIGKRADLSGSESRKNVEQMGGKRASGDTVQRQQSLLRSASKKMPPVYKSAPKQISGLAEIGRDSQRRQHEEASPMPKKVSVAAEVDERKASPQLEQRKSADLSTAAGGHHYKERRQGGKTKRRRKKKKIGGRRKMKIKKKRKPKVHHHGHHHQRPQHHRQGGLHHMGEHGHYYEYRAVPKKGAWKYGYKRGNKKHTIERKEHGHKSHFKTEVKWLDKKGKGHHLFDYNHHDKQKKNKHGDYHHAAASQAIHKPNGRDGRTGQKAAH